MPSILYLRLILINTNFAFRHTSIQYDACDENSWDFVGERYPLSNACGQLGQVSLSLQNSQYAVCWFESLIYRSFLLSFLIRTELSGLPLFSRGSPHGMRGRPGDVSCGRHTREGNQLREECVIRCSYVQYSHLILLASFFFFFSQWYGAPGPLYCGPKTEEEPHSGFWDHTYECKYFSLHASYTSGIQCSY